MNNREKLLEKIISHWKQTASYPSVFAAGITRKLAFSQMFVSLALAVFLWSTLVISQSEMLERVITVPVSYTASAPNLILVGDKQKEVRIHLAGPKSDFDSINLSELNAKIDLSKAIAGKQTFPISRENIKLPEDVNLLDVIPSNIELTLAEIEEREVTIKPQLVGKLPGKMKILSIEVNPEKVILRFPVNEGQKKVVSVITTPIYLESIYNDTKIYCKIIAPPTVQPIDRRWPDVEVVIKVGS